MKTMSIRHLLQKWPVAEALLQVEEEILTTRDASPVARLVRYVEPPQPRRRFDPVDHAQWQATVFGQGKVVRLVDKYLAKDRVERQLVARRK
jgi:hypothetical protein